MHLYNGLVTLGMVPVKVATGRSGRDQLIYAKYYFGINQTVSRDGLLWEIAPDVPEAIASLLLHERRASEFLLNLFKPQKVFVDVGANVGGYSVRAGAKGMKVFAFEPNPDIFRLMKRNAEINHVSLDAFQCALGSSNGQARLLVNGASSSISSEEGIPVEMRTLDSFSLPAVDLVKIDVESYELEVLQGARRTLEEYHPALMVEMHDWAGAKKEAALFGLLTELGYQFEYLDKFPKGRHLAAVYPA
ncbi:MAG: FkbM family methyltransferase [Thaumarchaeota archaeon]|nr:FkbM family methyltransferase [Nitrososphaerota archaeon]